eukprot:9338624-Ditylum_brightwellii.AAC.1
MGQYEVRVVLEQLKPTIQEEAGNCRKIVTKHPCSTWDNYFNDNRIMDWMGSEGFGGVMTCRRDCLPDDIPGEYLYKKKTDTSNRTKVTHFFNPVVAAKDMPAITEITRDADGNNIEKEVSKSNQHVHVSFQYTSLCNFPTVNALNKCKTTAIIKSRGDVTAKDTEGLR